MTKILNEEEIKDIKARADAATEGPWHYSTVDGMSYHIRTNKGGFVSHCLPDVSFIVHSRTDVPALCETVRALEAELTALKLWQLDGDLWIESLQQDNEDLRKRVDTLTEKLRRKVWANKRDIIKCRGCGRLSTPIEWETNRMHPEACPHCGGKGYYVKTGTAHDPRCDGTCQVGCPIPVQEQVECPCGGKQ